MSQSLPFLQLQVCDLNLDSKAPVTHTHLQTLRMIHKALPQLSVHSVTIRIASREGNSSYLIRNLPKTLSIRAQILKNIKNVLRMKTTQ